MATTKKTDIIKIYSNEKSVSHQPRNGEIYWLWDSNIAGDETYIEKTREEVTRELRESSGFRKMFELGILVVKDKEIVEEYRLNCLNEYIKNMAELKEFIVSSTIEQFEDYCMYAPEAMLQNIATICTENELTDTRKIKIYKDYTGKDLSEFYADNEDSGESDIPKETGKPAPRAKKNNTITNK